MRPPRPASTILPAAIPVTIGMSYTIAEKIGYRRQSSMSKAPEPPPPSSNFGKPPKSTASPRARAVRMESECMACQKVAIIAGSAPSKSFIIFWVSLGFLHALSFCSTVKMKWTGVGDEMAVTVEMQNTGDPALRQEVAATIEHALVDRPGDWRVSIIGSQANDRWEMKIIGPNAFERSYTLEGSSAEHRPEMLPLFQ